MKQTLYSLLNKSTNIWIFFFLVSGFSLCFVGPVSHTPSCIDVGFRTAFLMAQLGDNCAGRGDICGEDYGHKRVWDFMSEAV